MNETPKSSEPLDRIAYLPDHPVQADEFAGGAHKRTAKALVSSIMSMAKGGRAIGLEGSWGSGKSTVIEIARALLERAPVDSRTDAYSVFTFDVWAHQDDPIRRAFLEEFVLWLCKKGLISKEQSQDKLRKIQARIKKTTTSTVPTYTYVGMTAIILAPLLPLAYMWLSPFAFQSGESPNIDQQYTNNYVWIIALLIIVALYVPVILSWAREGRSGIGRALSLLSRGRDEEITEQLIRDEEPTTIEFSQIFDELITSSTSERSRIVIVLDNLDRLPPEQIRHTWATMRNFFATSASGARSDALENVWLVVPYDRAHMARVFFSDSEVSATDKDQRVAGFIEKTFEIVLRVSPPLLSDWQDYFLSKIKDAFADSLNDREKHRLFKILQNSFVEQGEHVTPRAVKSFVNSIVSLHLQWGKEIPVECFGLYTVKKSLLENDLSQLLNEKLLSRREAAFLSEIEWPRYLAALHFNVKPEDAYEILLSQDVERALLNADTESLVELQANRGFEPVLSNVLENSAIEWAKSGPANFARTCKALGELELSAPSVAESIWSCLGDATENIGTWSEIDSDIRQGIVTLLKSLDGRLLFIAADAVAGSLQSRIADELKSDFEAAREWAFIIDGIATVVKGKTQKGNMLRQLDRISIPGGPDFVCGVASVSKRLNAKKFADFTHSFKPDELGAKLYVYTKNKPLHDDLREIVEAIVAESDACDWPTVIRGVTERLEQNSPELSFGEARSLLDVLLIFYNSKDTREFANAALDQLLGNGTLLGLMARGLENKSEEMAGTAFGCIVLKNGAAAPPSPGSHAVYGDINQALNTYNTYRTNPESLPRLIESAADVFTSTESFNQLLNLSTSGGADHNAFRAMMRSVVDGARYSSLHVVKVFEKFDELAEVLGDEREIKFFRRFADWSTRFESLLKGDQIFKVSARFLKHALSQSGNEHKTVIELVTNHLVALDADVWRSSLTSENDNARLLLAMVGKSDLSLPPGNFREPLLEYARAILEQGKEPARYADDWHELPGALAKKSREVFYRELWSLVTEKTWEVQKLRALLKLFDPELGTEAPMENVASETIQRVVAPLVGEHHEEGLDWLQVHSDKVLRCVKQSSDDTADLLTEYFDGALTAADETQKGILLSLAKKWGVSLSFVDKGDEKSDS